MFVVTDEFGFVWGDVVETIEEARQQLANIRRDCKERLDWDYDGFTIERRG